MTSLKPLRIATIKQIPALYPGIFSASSIRWMFHNQEKNGFACCVRRIGRKIIIDLDLFDTWISQQNQTSNDYKRKKKVPRKTLNKKK